MLSDNQAGNVLAGLKWLAGGGSEYWDRRRQGKWIRLGATAFSRAREASCPYGLFVSPWCSRSCAFPLLICFAPCSFEMDLPAPPLGASVLGAVFQLLSAV